MRGYLQRILWSACSLFHRRCDKIGTIVKTSFFAGCQECVPFTNSLKTFGIRFLGGKSQRDAMSVDHMLKEESIS